MTSTFHPDSYEDTRLDLPAHYIKSVADYHCSITEERDGADLPTGRFLWVVEDINTTVRPSASGLAPTLQAATAIIEKVLNIYGIKTRVASSYETPRTTDAADLPF